MVVTHDPRPHYRKDIRDAYVPPSRTMLDTAPAFWTAVIAALAVTVVTWVVYVTLTGPGVPPWIPPRSRSRGNRSRRLHLCRRRDLHRFPSGSGMPSGVSWHHCDVCPWRSG